jgi:hypothetical protein
MGAERQAAPGPTHAWDLSAPRSGRRTARALTGRGQPEGPPAAPRRPPQPRISSTPPPHPTPQQARRPRHPQVRQRRRCVGGGHAAAAEAHRAPAGVRPPQPPPPRRSIGSGGAPPARPAPRPLGFSVWKSPASAETAHARLLTAHARLLDRCGAAGAHSRPLAPPPRPGPVAQSNPAPPVPAQRVGSELTGITE